MAKDWVELHKTSDPDIFDGIVEFQTRDTIPEYPPQSIVSALETTNRTDGPFAGRQYLESTDTWQDKPVTPPPPVRPEKSELDALITADAAAATAMNTLLVKAPSGWTDTDRSSSQRMTLRKAEIQRLKSILGVR